MKKGRIILFSTLILVFSILIFSLYNKDSINTNKQPELSSFQYKVPSGGSRGLSTYELTLENMVNKLSSNIVIGEVIDFEPSYVSESSYLYSVKVSENVLGDVNADIIKINTHNLNLEIGNSYLLFLYGFDSTLYPEKFYITNDEFILKIDETGTVYRLEDPENKIYIKPFKEEEFNNVANLKKYINEIKHDNYYVKNPSKPAKQKANIIGELISSSDHIIEINVKKIVEGNETLSAIEFDTKAVYKGGNFENLYTIAVPEGSVELGGDYLLFLVDNGQSVKLSTREGSIVNINSPEYLNIKKDLEKIKK